MNRILLRKAGVVSVSVALGAGGVTGAVSAQTPQVSASAAKLREPAAATPAMLQTVSPAIKANNVMIGGVAVRVTDDQIAAYNALPDTVKVKLKPPVGGKVLSAAELKKVSTEMSTVMCMW